MTQRVRIGVVGAGAIAQVHHLPNLMELAEEFEVAGLCDVSPQGVEYVADWFRVPNAYTDYQELLASDIDAVLLCQTDPKTEIALAALDAGKHLFIEKPICFSVSDADALVAAARKAGVVAQAGYMKLFEPAFERALTEVRSMPAVRFVEVRHLHPNNDLHVRQFRTRKFDDVPADTRERMAVEQARSVREAIGDVSPGVQRAFRTLAGSLIHDLYGLRVLFGLPKRVLHTDIWQDGRAITTTFEYPSGTRCVATWVDLPDLWDFQETLEVFGDAARVAVSYATGFSKNQSKLTIHGIDEKGESFRKEPALDWESPFRRELRHFHDAIVNGTPGRSPISDARHDVALIVDIIRAYVDQAPAEIQP